MQVTEKGEVLVWVHNACGTIWLEGSHWVFLNITQALDSCIGKDEHLAVAFFQRGLTFYKKERQDKSIILGIGD